jgi:hypothetical protein
MEDTDSFSDPNNCNSGAERIELAVGDLTIRPSSGFNEQRWAMSGMSAGQDTWPRRGQK